MSTTGELLARLVNLENEAVQAWQRQGSADMRCQRPNNVSSSYPQEAAHLHRQLESSTRVLWASRRRSRISHRNGQPGNSRSKRLRVRRIQE